MANYSTFQVNAARSETAKTYYDLDDSATETVEHKHCLRASASTDGAYSDSANEVTLTFTGAPDIKDSTKFVFDESKSRITSLAGYDTVDCGAVHLNKDAANGVSQLFGKYISVSSGLSYYIAFSACPTTLTKRGSIRSLGMRHIGSFEGACEYSHTESSRNTVVHYIGVRYTSYNTLAPIEVKFAGAETWTKAYSETFNYYLVADSTPNLYRGKAISASMLNNLCMKYDYSATKPTRNGFAWPDGATKSTTSNVDHAIAVSEIVSGIPSSTSYTIQVDANKKDSSGNPVYLTYSANVIQLSATPFLNFKAAVTAYAIGDTIDLSSIASNSKNWEGALLTYTDGTTIPLSSVELAANSEISATMSVNVGGTTKTNLRTLTIENLTSYSNCVITLTIPTKYFGTLTVSYDVEITEALAYALTLSGVKTDFKYGETAIYGSGATAKLVDISGTEITLADNSVSALLTSGTIIADSKIISGETLTNVSDVSLNGKTGQGKIKTTLQNANYYEYLIYVSYCDSYALSQTNLGDLYVNSGETTSISTLLSSITAKYTYHENKATGSSSTDVDLANASLTFSQSSVTATSDQSNLNITVSAVPSQCPNQTLSKKVSLNVIVNKFTGLQVTHAATGNTYYAGRDNTFVLPNDLVVKKIYNNPTLDKVALTNEEVLSLQFRINDGTSGTALTATSSTIPSSTNTIYVTLTLGDGTVLQGSYSIAKDYQPDTISSFSLGTSFTLTLGTKLSTYKNNGSLKMIAHYASGYNTNITTDIFTDYSIVQMVDGEYLDYEKVIMESADFATIYIKWKSNYYAVSSNSQITAVVPTGHIALSGYQQTFVNTVDKIDFSAIQGEVTYDDTDSKTTVKELLDSGNVATATTYSLACSGITSFAGTESFNITDEGLTFVRTITVTTKNRFDSTQDITASLSVTVVSINGLTITRLVVRDPKTEYKVGETFLNGQDKTILDIYYSGSSVPVVVYLKDIPTVVATDPSQGTVFTRTNDSMTVTVRLLTDTTKYTTYTAKVVSAASSSTTIVHNIVALLVPNGTVTGIEDLDSENHFYYDANGYVACHGRYVLVDSAYTSIDSSGTRVLNSGVNISSIKIYGYLEDLFNTNLSARVILFDDYVPPVSTEANIEVKFPCYVPTNEGKINNCHIAQLFGNSNAKNRLFVSGNTDSPNCDWHSGQVNTYVQQGETVDANGDFSYFGDMDYCFYGQTDNAIMGYDHVATDKMVVLKSKSKVEPTNYFRSSTLTQAMDAGGNLVSSIDNSTLYMESFPLATGNIGAGAMNYKSIANLNGDTLFISSDNTICGLDITGQVGDSQRISYSRSRRIDPELKGLDLTDAALWTDNKSLFLFTDEASYMTHYESYSSDDNQYEWWKIDVKGIRCAIDIDNVIYFGTDSGSLYKFDENLFFDCDKIFIESGGTLYVSLSTLFDDNKIVYSQSINSKLDESADYTFSMIADTLQLSLFRKVASIGNAEAPNLDILIDYDSNTLKIVALDSNGIFNASRYQVLEEELSRACKFYLNHADGLSAIEGISSSPVTEYFRSYTLEATDDSDDEFKLIDSDGNEVELSRTVTSGGHTSKASVLVSATLCRVLDGEYDVCDLDKTDCSFCLKDNGRILDIVRYGNQNLAAQSFSSEIHKHTPVSAYFIAAPAVLGSISYRKTIWSWTLSAFREANDLEVCEATNEENLEQMRTMAFADSVPIGNSFKHFSFEKVDFGKYVVPRKYTYIRPLVVPFIAFGFKSNKSENSILTATSIVYTVPLMGRGRF